MTTTAPEATAPVVDCADCGAPADAPCDASCSSATSQLLHDLLAAEDAEDPCHRSPLAAAAALCGCWS